jgi:hypothetical protein
MTLLDLLLQDTGNNVLPHDLAIVDGDLVLTKDNVNQAIRCRLKVLFREWYLDVAEGIPYMEAILVKNPNIPAIEAIFVDKLASTRGVLEILSLDLTPDFKTRKATLRTRIRTKSGTIEMNEALP